jgi:hypothetical protein
MKERHKKRNKKPAICCGGKAGCKGDKGRTKILKVVDGLNHLEDHKVNQAIFMINKFINSTFKESKRIDKNEIDMNYIL